MDYTDQTTGEYQDNNGNWYESLDSFIEIQFDNADARVKEQTENFQEMELFI